jgi:hypothetical protein
MAINSCTNEAVKRELIRASMMPLRDLLTLYMPIENLLAPVLGNSIVEARMSFQDTWDRAAFMEAGGIHIVIGEGLALDSLRFLRALDFQRLMELQMKVKRPGLYVFDEMNRLGVTSNDVLRMATMRNYRATLVYLCQFLPELDSPELLRGFLTNSDHWWLPQQSPEMAEMAVSDCRGLLDEYHVHHHEYSQRQYSDLQWIERETLTEGPHGKSKSKTLVPVSIPRIVNEERPVYSDHRSQVFWRACDLMESPVGRVWVKPRMGKPYVFQSPNLRKGWGWPEVAKERFEELYELNLRNPVFEEPVEWEFPEIRRDGRQTNLQKHATNGRGNGSSTTQARRRN